MPPAQAIAVGLVLIGLARALRRCCSWFLPRTIFFDERSEHVVRAIVWMMNIGPHEGPPMAATLYTLTASAARVSFGNLRWPLLSQALPRPPVA